MVVDDLSKLISLKHFDCVSIQTDGIGKLKCLKSKRRCYFDLRYVRWSWVKRTAVPEWASGVSAYENVKRKKMASVANLADKVHMDEFFLEWYFYDEASNLRDSDMGVLEGCKPPAQLSKLHIIGERGRQYPNWLLYNHGMSENLQLL